MRTEMSEEQIPAFLPTISTDSTFIEQSLFMGEERRHYALNEI